MSHQAKQSDRLHGYGLAACIGAADQQCAMLLVEFQRDRSDLRLAPLQHVFEQGMASVLQMQSPRIIWSESWNRAVEFEGELRLGEQELELRHSIHGITDVWRM